MESLDSHLKQFYASVRTKEGEHFKTNSFQNLRYGLCKYVKAETGIDIVGNDAFDSSKQVYRAVLVDLKKKGFGNTEHIAALSPEDMERFYDPAHLVFSTAVPVWPTEEKFGLS